MIQMKTYRSTVVCMAVLRGNSDSLRLAVAHVGKIALSLNEHIMPGKGYLDEY